jgi:hypothetical protein
MFKTTACMALIALTFVSFAARAECTFPKSPEAIPDGKTASAEQMTTAMQAFKAYNESVNAFGACLNEDSRQRSTSAAQLMQIKTMQSKKHNAAVAELQEKAKLFNEQVRIFKARG